MVIITISFQSNAIHCAVSVAFYRNAKLAQLPIAVICGLHSFLSRFIVAVDEGSHVFFWLGASQFCAPDRFELCYLLEHMVQILSSGFDC